MVFLTFIPSTSYRLHTWEGSILSQSTSFYEVQDQHPIYEDFHIGPLKEGLSFTITGYIKVNCERFSINFIVENEYRDVALHINPRLPQSFIVRNTKVKNVWGREEGFSALPFTLARGSNFSIQVLITEASYMISVNGYHFAEYNHRLPYSQVATLEVKGDIERVDMQRQHVFHYPERILNKEQDDIRLKSICKENIEEADSGVDDIDGDQHFPEEFRLVHVRQTVKLDQNADTETAEPRLTTVTQTKFPSRRLALPYYGHFSKNSLISGRTLHIEGRVKLLPHSFYINLQTGQDIWPHPIIAFHFNPRFTKQSSGTPGKAIICRNAWFDGKWDTEERSEMESHLRPGITFKLSIACGEKEFSVYVNKMFLTSFEHRIKPEEIDTVYIQGDIKLWDVFLETKVLNRAVGGDAHIYNNPGFDDTGNLDDDDDDVDVDDNVGSTDVGDERVGKECEEIV